MRLWGISLLGATFLAAQRAVPTPKPPRGSARTAKQLNGGTDQIPSKAGASSVATSSRSLENEHKRERGRRRCAAAPCCPGASSAGVSAAPSPTLSMCTSSCLLNPATLLPPSPCWGNELPSLTGMNVRDNTLCSAVSQIWSRTAALQGPSTAGDNGLLQGHAGKAISEGVSSPFPFHRPCAAGCLNLNLLSTDTRKGEHY